MQALVNRYPDRLSDAVGAAIGQPASSLSWVSPLADDDFAEYRDEGFLSKLGISLSVRSLESFWPARGPQWDALAVTPNSVVLVEAKSHLNELGSKCAAGDISMLRIREAMRTVQQGIGIAEERDWTTQYYQYANRIAHLYLLRELNGIDAELVLLCFVNDREMNGPSLDRQWLDAFKVVESSLGILPHALMDHVHHVFIDVSDLQKLRT
jgi:hypothetical protein